MQKQSTPFDLSRLAEKWPSAVVARCKVAEFTGGAVTSGYMANMDSRGEGPEERAILNGKTVYPVESFVRWLKNRAIRVSSTEVARKAKLAGEKLKQAREVQ